MRKYNIAINGKTYEVGVEEVGTTLTGKGYIRPASELPTAPALPPAPAPAPTGPPAVPVLAVEKTSKAPKAEPKPKPTSPAADVPISADGKAEIKTGVSGRVFKMQATVGQTIKTGDVIMVLEAMKMEIPILASEDGIIADIKVAIGDSVETGQTLATLK